MLCSQPQRDQMSLDVLPHCWRRWSPCDWRWRSRPWWETCPRSTSAGAAGPWSRNPSGEHVQSQLQTWSSSERHQQFGLLNSYPLVVWVDSYSHHTCSREAAELWVLELWRRNVFIPALKGNKVWLSVGERLTLTHLFWNGPRNEITRRLLPSGQTVQDGLSGYFSLQTNLRKHRQEL